MKEYINIQSFDDVDLESVEGRLLFGAILRLMTTVDKNKSANEVLLNLAITENDIVRVTANMKAKKNQ